MRLMYDAVDAFNIPATASMVAGYCDTITIPQWTESDWARFPNATKVRIAKKADTNDGHVLDIERGDATPAQAPGWVMLRRSAGIEPTVYCSASEWDTVRSAFLSTRTPEPNYWIAHYDGIAQIPPGAVAKQYLNTPGYDLSVVADYWPGVDAALTNSIEEFVVEGYKTATQLQMSIPCNGLTSLFCLVGGTGQTVDGHLYFIADTPPGTAAAHYLGDRPVHFDADRPGPVTVPAGCRGVTFFYTASAPFSAWCA